MLFHGKEFCNIPVSKQYTIDIKEREFKIHPSTLSIPPETNAAFAAAERHLDKCLVGTEFDAGSRVRDADGGPAFVPAASGGTAFRTATPMSHDTGTLPPTWRSATLQQRTGGNI